MLGTDLGFVAYWTAIALDLVPPELAYSDYRAPIVVAWNWSFLPLDLLVSATGMLGLWGLRGRPALGHVVVLISLALTHASGLFALSYWVIRGEFSPQWWAPNLLLLLYPLPAIAWLLTNARVPAET
jgi:hypothetical protein